MKNMSKMLFFFMLMLSILIMISTNNWFSMWMSLEINMIAFLPIMYEKNYLNSKNMIIYFLIQTMSSMIFIFSMIFMYKNYMMNMINMIMLMSILMKMGVPPLHLWLPMIMENMNWYNSFLLMTFQKIIPMMIMTYLMNMDLIIYIVLISAIISAIGGLNETSLQKIMAYSSMNHSSWMILSMKFENKLWIIYLIIYTLIMMMIIIIMNNYNIFYINQMNMNMNIMEKMFMMFNFMSLGGLPPFLGFLPKWLILQFMMNMKMYYLMFIMIMMSLIILYFYLQIINSSLMINSNLNKWIFMKKLNIKYNYMIMFMNLTLPMMMMLMIFL
uniref:NADH-ubiquinone oxidoreductase chain 2 n=1 Tax=Aenictopecheidae sp. PJ-2015 TaxID=1663421 RepID=A0A3S6CJY7_9HEMI|nr:NADH dehydrogenase subunit 2 [Aenictopecheidae sp. PJ-2015]